MIEDTLPKYNVEIFLERYNANLLKITNSTKTKKEKAIERLKTFKYCGRLSWQHLRN